MNIVIITYTNFNKDVLIVMMHDVLFLGPCIIYIYNIYFVKPSDQRCIKFGLKVNYTIIIIREQ